MDDTTIYVLGYIWWPHDVLCATVYNAPHDEDPEQWLSTHSGDFSEITAYAIKQTHRDIDHDDELGRATMTTTETYVKDMSDAEWDAWRDCYYGEDD